MKWTGNLKKNPFIVAFNDVEHILYTLGFVL